MRRRALRAGLLLTALTTLAGCNNSQSVLSPRSEPARDISTLWWWMLLAATIVFVGSLSFIVLAFVLRRRRGAPVIGEREGTLNLVVILFGIAIPLVAVIAVFAVANFVVVASTDARPDRPRDVTVKVVGRQWWWEIDYPGTSAVTANEMHIPVRTHVDVQVRSADVIHSFWVPRLNRKIDLIPGEHNHVGIYADRPGRYEGQCAEYCGLQHANMRLYVIAEPMSRYRAWLRREAAPAAAPTGATAQRGERLFLRNACASCHQIRGTSADGRVGPDLTHLAERSSLAALTISNTPSNLARWVRNPQHIKPGNRMPGLHLGDRDFTDIVTYLRGLR